MARNPWKGIRGASRRERLERMWSPIDPSTHTRAAMRNKQRRVDARARVPGTLSWARTSEDCIGVKQVAKLIGRSQTYVRTHAEELGGTQFSNRRLGINRPGHTWCFSRARIERLVSA